MRISTKGRYALRMLTDIALNQGDSSVALKDVAERQDISKKYLEQIAVLLGQAGVLRGSRGHQGGYRLAGEPEEYSIQYLLNLVEGCIAPVACLDCEPDDPCPYRDICLTLPLWVGLDKVVNDYLSHITLRDLLSGNVPEAEISWKKAPSDVQNQK